MRKAGGGAVHHSPASGQEEKLSKRSLCCQISALCELKDFFVVVIIPSPAPFCSSSQGLVAIRKRSLSDGHGEQLLLGL